MYAEGCKDSVVSVKKKHPCDNTAIFDCISATNDNATIDNTILQFVNDGTVPLYSGHFGTSHFRVIFAVISLIYNRRCVQRKLILLEDIIYGNDQESGSQY